MDGDIKSCVIMSEAGWIVDMLQTNEKGYKKSIENSRIWAVNPETERLLPVDDYGAALAFRERDGWYEITVEAGADDSEDGASAATADDLKTSAADENGAGASIISRLYGVIEQRKREMPEGSYTTHLFNSGMSKIKKKTGEEAVELLLAEDRGEMIYEAADLIYHMLVMLAEAGIKPDEIFTELERRE